MSCPAEITPANDRPMRRGPVFRFKTLEEADAWEEKYRCRVRTTESDATALAAASKALEQQTAGKAD